MVLSQKILNWLIIGYCSVIMFLSIAVINTTATLNKTKIFSIRSDYLLHVLLFIPWMILANWRWRKEKNKKKVFYLALAAGLLLASLSEGVQYWLPYRAFNFVDLGANLVGIVFGALISGWGGRLKAVVSSQ